MLALSTAAIVSVYAVGYADTGQGNSSPPAGSDISTSAAAASNTGASSGPSGGSSRSTRSTATPTPTPTQSKYADGSYAAIGSSRHGSIEATVVVQGGKIVSADITGCGTRYPCSRVSQLPARVVAAQSTNVHYVSGATDSSQAYLRAVAAALKQAGAAS